MSKGDVFVNYESMSAAERRTFDRWLKTSAVVGSIVAATVFVMALAASNSVGPQQAEATALLPSDISAAEKRPDQGGVLSAYQLMIRVAPDQLPVRQVNEPF